MKKTLRSLLIGLAIGGSFVFGRYYGAYVAGKRPVLTPSNQTSAPLDANRTLLLVMDGPDIFCAGDKVPSEALEAYVRRTMELNDAGRVAVYASETARYGDVVVLVEKLARAGLTTKLASKTVAPGTRMPLTLAARVEG